MLVEAASGRRGIADISVSGGLAPLIEALARSLDGQQAIHERLDKMSAQIEELLAAKPAHQAAEEWLSIGDVSTLTKKSPETVRSWINKGNGPLKAERWGNGRDWRVLRSDLDAFLGAPKAARNTETGDKIRKALAALNKKAESHGG